MSLADSILAIGSEGEIVADVFNWMRANEMKLCPSV
jgi:hypothetical protein